MIKKKHLIIFFLILTLLIIGIILRIRYVKNNKDSVHQYAEFVSANQPESITPEEEKTSPVNVHTGKNPEIGKFKSNISEYETLSSDAVEDDDISSIYIKDSSVGNDGFTSAIVAATTVFESTEIRPTTVLEARSLIQDVNINPYNGATNEWDEAEKYLVRKVAYYDPSSATAQITYTLIPKKDADDICMYVTVLMAAKNHPLTEEVYTSTIDGLKNMAGTCSFFETSYDEISNELDNILYYKSSSKYDVPYTTKIFLDNQRENSVSENEDSEDISP